MAFSSVKAVAALLVLLSALCAAAPAFGQSVERKALVALCDPAKIATLKSDRAANPRIRKNTYWLEVTHMNGNSPEAEMDAVMEALGWGGTMKGELTAKAMTRNRTIAERLGWPHLGQVAACKDTSCPHEGQGIRFARSFAAQSLTAIPASATCELYRPLPWGKIDVKVILR